MPNEWIMDGNTRRQLTDAEQAARDAAIAANIDAARIPAVNARTQQLIAVGYTYRGKTFSASPHHQTWALGVLVGIGAGLDFAGTTIPTIDDQDSHTLADNADAAAMAGACIAHVKTHLASGAALKKQLAEAADAEARAAIVDNR